MHVIAARNVNDAYKQGLDFLQVHGESQSSRAGDVLVSPTPVTTVYHDSLERVLFDPKRDANPFFHLFESLWMLAGCNEASWLDQFVRNFSSRFAEDDGLQHGAYGYRWRRHFDLDAGGHPLLPDQLAACIEKLKANPNDRQAVLTMWDPVADLGGGKRDLPCNTHVYLRVRQEIEIVGWTQGSGNNGAHQEQVPYLDITVCCRSNDAIWGAYGANAVHFSVLHEYLAAMIGVKAGIYYQISNNFHLYKSEIMRIGWPEAIWDYYKQELVRPRNMINTPDCFDDDLLRFMDWTALDEPDQEPQEYPNNPWLQNTAEPLFVASKFWRGKDRDHALALVSDLAFDIAPDWRLAVMEWMKRRLSK